MVKAEMKEIKTINPYALAQSAKRCGRMSHP
jgi:hypothetical protein